MEPQFRFEADAFVIENYNEARPFSSFLPGIAGELGKPLWLFYTNRGQCVSSFGVHNKNSAMLEFYPANRAYQRTPFLGFRTFFRMDRHIFEAFRPGNDTPQILRIRPHEIELTEHFRNGLTVRAVVFNAPNESLPFLIRSVQFMNTGKKPIDLGVIDGLPQVVPFGLSEFLLKQMSRTMEAFAEVRHVDNHLPFYKLKVEPSDRPEVQRIDGGFFAFALIGGRSLKILTDPEAVFGCDTSFAAPRVFASRRFGALRAPRTESTTGSAFSTTRFQIKPGGVVSLQSFYGQADAWCDAAALRERLLQEPDYVGRKREENRLLIQGITDLFPLHSSDERLNAYTRQAFLDNTLRGGQPFRAWQERNGHVFHYFSRKHGDMERDYNFFEVAPTYFSQGNGNFRDVNQNRRSEVALFPDVQTANIETFFNLLQLDGFNPLVVQHETFYVEPDVLPTLEIFVDEKDRGALNAFLLRPFSPGALFEQLTRLDPDRSNAYQTFLYILGKTRKIQEAVHGEGFWVDHWTYNLDLLENYAAIYPDSLRALFIERRDFTWFDSEHVVQPRAHKTIRRADGAIRQLHAVMVDPEKKNLIGQRAIDPNKVRTHHGTGDIYKTTLLVKMLGLLAVKAASLDPFGVGIEMEADKPGWCDALNGLPALFGSSVNEAFELRRWISFVQNLLTTLFNGGLGEVVVPVEFAGLIKAVTDTLVLADAKDFYRTWDTLASAKENFREQTRLGLDGAEQMLSRREIESFLSAVAKVLDVGRRKAFQSNGLCVTYFTHEPVRWETLPMRVHADPKKPSLEAVKVLEFRQKALPAFLEGPVHGLRTADGLESARRLYRAVKRSGLYDTALKMFRLNLPLDNESDDIGRAKIFSPGWLENESIFLHMAYKFMLETLRSGLIEEFFVDLKNGLVAFQDPRRYGRSTLENSSFIASSRFPDRKEHGRGFVARLTGATAEWISMVLHMGLGARPFQWKDGELRFEPKPTLPSWLFTHKPSSGFEKNTFGFRFLGQAWMVYRNPLRKNTYGKGGAQPVRFELCYADGRSAVYDGPYLPDPLARDLRNGKLSRLTIDLA